MDKLIYGKNPTKNIVNVSYTKGKAHIYTEDQHGVNCKKIAAMQWILTNKPYSSAIPLYGENMYYRYMNLVDEVGPFTQELRQNRIAFETKYNSTENLLIRLGYTYYKGMEPKDVSILSFDIETNGLTMNEYSEIFMISNTFRKGDYIERKLFSLDDHTTPANMLEAWIKWVNEKDPSIMTGHNIFGFDLPYIRNMAKLRKVKLELGRDGSVAEFSKRPRKFRKDGSQSYDYHNVKIFGRELVDTFFLSIKYDTARDYPSYALKEIIKHEGLERSDRQHYDAASIATLWYHATERVKIKRYAEHDADDALALFDLMIPAFFYYNRSIPRSLQDIINSASGSQINSFLTRAYLQDLWGLPKASEGIEYEGAISYGNPGVYKDVYKVDVASLYPSIIIEDKLSDTFKDPRNAFYDMVCYFTEERLQNQAKAEKTGKRKYRDLSKAQKIMINSAYGFLGAPGLNFNSPSIAAHITKRGRDILTTGIKWAESKGYTIVNVDTDSFSFCGDIVDYDKEREGLNALYSDHIHWKNEGCFEKVLVVKAKNYVLYDGENYTIKGSGLKGTMKEKALQKFMKDVIVTLISGQGGLIPHLYDRYAIRIKGITDITDWCSKKTVTDKVLNPKRTNEARILDAIGTKPVREGDKIFVFFKEKEELCLAENFTGEYHVPTLHSKLFKTIKIFEPVLKDMEFKNYSLKRHREEI